MKNSRIICWTHVHTFWLYSAFLCLSDQSRRKPPTSGSAAIHRNELLNIWWWYESELHAVFEKPVTFFHEITLPKNATAQRNQVYLMKPVAAKVLLPITSTLCPAPPALSQSSPSRNKVLPYHRHFAACLRPADSSSNTTYPPCLSPVPNYDAPWECNTVCVCLSPLDISESSAYMLEEQQHDKLYTSSSSHLHQVLLPNPRILHLRIWRYHYGHRTCLEQNPVKEQRVFFGIYNTVAVNN